MFLPKCSMIFYAWNALDSHQSLGVIQQGFIFGAQFGFFAPDDMFLARRMKVDLADVQHVAHSELGRLAGMKLWKQARRHLLLYKSMMTWWTDFGSRIYFEIPGWFLRFLLVTILSCLIYYICCPQWHFFDGSLRPAWWSCSRSHATIGHTRPTCWSKRDLWLCVENMCGWPSRNSMWVFLADCTEDRCFSDLSCLVGPAMSLLWPFCSEAGCLAVD